MLLSPGAVKWLKRSALWCPKMVPTSFCGRRCNDGLRLAAQVVPRSLQMLAASGIYAASDGQHGSETLCLVLLLIWDRPAMALTDLVSLQLPTNAASKSSSEGLAKIKCTIDAFRAGGGVAWRFWQRPQGGSNKEMPWTCKLMQA